MERQEMEGQDSVPERETLAMRVNNLEMENRSLREDLLNHRDELGTLSERVAVLETEMGLGVIATVR